MNLMLRFVKPYKAKVILTIIIKFIAVISELLIPYTLEYIIDVVAPEGDINKVCLYGVVMILFALITLVLNVAANRMATCTSRNAIKEVRKELFRKTMYLSGNEIDMVSLPSVISRMTSDSYNVGNFIGMVQRMGVRAPIMLIGGIIIAGSMDISLTIILICMIPVLVMIVIYISKTGIPLFRNVQNRLDGVVRIMRENIAGIRVIRALSRHDYEEERYAFQSDELKNEDVKAGMVMALPNPVMNLFLNIGLTLIILVGAYRVNDGLMKTGVILAFLTYFNMIIQSVMGINRIFIQYSKAGASADRIDEVLHLESELHVIEDERVKYEDYAVVFDNVSIHKMGLCGISFKLKRGESLGIIGSTGSGKTTVLNLMMRFYDADEGEIWIDGRNIKSYDLKELRRRFGVVFQNDMIFNDSIGENIKFGREMTEERMKQAAKDARIASHIETLPGGYEYVAAIKGMNLSGGQRQRLLIARALAGDKDIIVLDDSSSALDYRTDSYIRKCLEERYSDVTKVIIAQRVSSVKSMNSILVMDRGHVIGSGRHGELMESCDMYKEIAKLQMGEERTENAAN